jgi:cytochrome c biogenesis protein
MSTTVKDRAEGVGRAPQSTDHSEGGVDVLDGSVHEPQHRGDLLGHVWRFFISMRTGLVLILILGALTLLGTLLMQASGEALADQATYQQWYEAGPKLKYGGWAPILNALGMFQVFSTWYFRALFAILALSILACSVNRAPRLWRVATRPKTSMTDAFFERAPLHATFDLPGDVDSAVARVKKGLRHEHFRVLDGVASKGADVYADRFRWGPFGTVVAHLSFIVILAGFVVSANMGFKDSSVIAPVGVPVEVGHGTGLTVTAMSFQDSYYDDGTPKDYVSDLVVTKGGAQVARQETRVNSPLVYDGVWFHQAFFGVGADISATSGGKSVFTQTVPLQWNSSDGQQSIGQFNIPSAGITVYVIEAASGQVLADLPAGSAALEVHTTGVTDPTVQVVSQGKSVTIGDVTYTFARNRQYTGLAVTRDPGSPLVWIGSALLILGSYLVFFLPHRRVWIRVRPGADGTSRVQLGSALKRDPAFEPRFDALVSRLQADQA